jgi:homoserine kinase
MAESSAPASSANLGPGFDVLAIALDLRCVVQAEESDEWRIHHGDGQRPEEDSDDAVMAAAMKAVGSDRPLALHVRNEIPIGRGMGSSAAAIAAGAAAALGVVDQPVDHDRVFELTAEIEGHPDNAAAAVYGGRVLVPAEGRPMRLPIHPSLRPVVAIPESVFLTSDARRILPESVGRRVAVRTVARAAALVAGFLTGDAALLAAAHGDEMHEQPRSGIHPATAHMVDRARDAGALHAAWSGSGPSVVAIVDGRTESAVAAALTTEGVRVLRPAVAAEGLVCSA